MINVKTDHYIERNEVRKQLGTASGFWKMYVSRIVPWRRRATKAFRREVRWRPPEQARRGTGRRGRRRGGEGWGMGRARGPRGDLFKVLPTEISEEKK